MESLKAGAGSLRISASLDPPASFFAGPGGGAELALHSRQGYRGRRRARMRLVPPRSARQSGVAGPLLPKDEEARIRSHD